MMHSIRDMEIEDIPRCFEVRTSTVENALTMQELQEYYDINPETLAKAMAGTHRGWVCEVDGEVVGFAMGDSANSEVTVLAVLPGFEKRGIGCDLLVQVRDWLVGSGSAEPWLMTTADPGLRAYGFYLAQGWTATGEMDEDEERFVYRLDS